MKGGWEGSKKSRTGNRPDLSMHGRGTFRVDLQLPLASPEHLASSSLAKHGTVRKPKTTRLRRLPKTQLSSEVPL